MERLYNFAPPEIQVVALLPMIIVALTGLAALIVEMVSPKRNNNLIVSVSLAGLFLAGVSLVAQLGSPSYDTAAGMVIRDSFAIAMQLIVVVAVALVIIFSESYLREKRIPFGEFYPLMVWSALGAMIMVSTKNLLMVFIGLEILSIALYVLAGIGRAEERSNEAALKYFLLGAFASGFLLYGIAFVYGATGGLHLDGVMLAWVRNVGSARTLLLFGLGLMLIGFGFKSSFVPFHQWTPDVYQGAPTNVTAFMATVAKIGAFGALWRVLDSFQILSGSWIAPLAVIAALTMLIGNSAAVVQKDMKRVLGYSSVSHAGYILVAMLAHAKEPQKVGFETVTYYLTSYSLMTIGAFAVISLTARNGREGTSFEDIRGLWKRSPIAATALLICMASLIGIPGTGGFIGKLMIFSDALKAQLVPLAVVLAVASIISVYYYLSIVRAVFSGDEVEPNTAPMSNGVAVTSILCAAGVLVAGIFVGPTTSAMGMEKPAASAYLKVDQDSLAK